MKSSMRVYVWIALAFRERDAQAGSHENRGRDVFEDCAPEPRLLEP
jgi:hypothetical protein